MAAELLRRRLLVVGLALAVVAAVGLPAFRPIVEGPLSAPFGLAVGLVLFGVLAGRPRLPVSRAGLLGRGLYLAAGAGIEELLWRGYVFAALVPPLGTAAALAVTTVGFASAHVGLLGRSAAIHLLTGVGFGGAFVVAGLPAATCAHAGYNVLVDLAVRSVQEDGS